MNIKKFLYGIAFIICVTIVKPLTVSASYLPPVSPETSMIPSFLETVAQYEMMENGVYVNPGDVDRLNSLLNGRSVSSSMQEAYIDNGTLGTQLQDFYNSNGDLVSQADTYTAFGESDLGRYTYIAEKNTGEILFSYDELNHLNSTLQADAEREISFPRFVLTYLTGTINPPLVNQVIDKVAEQNAPNGACVIYANTLSDSAIDFAESYEFHLIAHSNNFGWDLYVPNGCTSDTVVVPSGNGNLYEYHGNINPPYFEGIPMVYTNDVSAAYWSGSTSWIGFRENPVNYFGKTFRYVPSYFQIVDPMGGGGYLDFKAPTASEYQQHNLLSNQVVYVQPIINEGDTTNVYNYSVVGRQPVSRNTTINNSYNNTYPVTYNNYPVNNTVTMPSYTTNSNTYVTNINNYYTTPNANESGGTVDDENLTDNIPILSNLEQRFPFSIPFDIYNLIQGLSVQREAPSFDWEIYFPVIDYTWEIDFDLSSWDSQAGIFRTCFLILFIIALAMWAYNHFFGN